VALTLDSSSHHEPEGLSHGEALRFVPRHATGIELAGRLEGSGYHQAPWLVRRADGQVLQLTPALYAVLDAIDGERDAAGISAAVAEHHQLEIDPADIEFLVTERLRPLGVLVRDDGTEPEVKRSNPLLGIRGRARMVSPERTDRIARHFQWLYRPLVLLLVLAAFVATSWYVFVTEGLGAALHDLFNQPGALLAVIALTIVSAGFHEIGHATACRYGGARPGVMGAGLYLIWPAFYTDVSDSYRLPRRDRLRVDLGGLYFNAVFGLATMGVWAVTGWDPLLVLFVLQLAQMARQLAPMLRFDGYHVLADLVGVPDLYTRIGPVLRSLLPWRRRRPDASALKLWARAVISVWVLLVVPILLFSVLIMVLSFPRLAATAASTIANQWAVLRVHWGEADLVRTTLDVFGIISVALPVAGAILIVTRLGRGLGGRAWRSTDGNPPARRALVLGALGVAMVLGALWWPQGQYRPIQRDEPLTLPVVTHWIGDAITGDFDLGADEHASALAEERVRLAASSVRSDVQEADAPSSATGPAGGYVFATPPAPGPGDNQAVAVSYDDGQTVTDSSTAMTWERDGSDVDNRNEAYALASCLGCRTRAVAFQVLLVVGHHGTIAPSNKAVALNERCVRCSTRSLAIQLVLPLDVEPDAATKAQLDSIWARAAGVDVTLRTRGFDAARSLVLDIEHDIAVLLELDDDLAAATSTTTTAGPDVTATPTRDGSATTPTTRGLTPSSEPPTPTTEPASETTTTDPPTTTTEPPASTTTTEPPP
jgi:putative peptide zinc metalloprotease protein